MLTGAATSSRNHKAAETAMSKELVVDGFQSQLGVTAAQNADHKGRASHSSLPSNQGREGCGGQEQPMGRDGSCSSLPSQTHRGIGKQQDSNKIQSSPAFVYKKEGSAQAYREVTQKLHPIMKLRHSGSEQMTNFFTRKTFRKHNPVSRAVTGRAAWGREAGGCFSGASHLPCR